MHKDEGYCSVINQIQQDINDNSAIMQDWLHTTKLHVIEKLDAMCEKIFAFNFQRIHTKEVKLKDDLIAWNTVHSVVLLKTFNLVTIKLKKIRGISWNVKIIWSLLMKQIVGTNQLNQWIQK